MRKILAVLLLSAPLLAQTTGAPLNLALPNVHSSNWNVPLNNNFTTINSSYALTALKNNPVFTGIVTFPTTLNGCLSATAGVVSANGLACGSGSGGGAVTSVFTRTGAVVANTGDYSFTQIAGTVAASQLPLATNAAVGGVRPDGTTITVSGGVLSAVSASTGFPITLGTTSIPANSINNSLSGLTINNVTLTAAGSASNFLNAAGAYVTLPAPPVTSVGATSPIVSSGGSAPNISCATCVFATSPGTGIAHFAGGTQAVTSSKVALTTDVSGILPIANGGTGTSSPSLVAGSGISVTGSWPNQTVAATGGGAGVSSVSNTDGTLTISPTTGAVVASIALGHANTWTAPVTVSVAGGQGGTFDMTEGTVATLTSGHDVIYGDSTAHCAELSNNGGSPTCITSGTGTAPVEAFGAVGYTTLAAAIAGTDSTTSIQNCLNSFNGIGGQCLLQAKYYRITSALSITHSGVGLKGVVPLVTNNTFIPAPVASAIVTTSASADLIDVAGTSATQVIANNRFENFTLMRSVAPSGTATGFSLNNTAGVYLNGVVSEDSIRGFYIHATGSIGIGDIINSAAQWGYNGVTEASGNFYGFYADSADGNGNNSLRLRNDFVASNLGATPVTYGYYTAGSAINDLMVWNFETAGTNYGVYASYTGSGTFSTETDIHFYGSVFDGCTTSCIFVTGLTSAGAATMQFVGGWSDSTSGNSIDIESSSGVQINGMQVIGGPNTIYVNGSSNIGILGNTLPKNGSNGIVLNNTTNSVVSGNVVVGTSGANDLILLTTASTNVISNNSVSGLGAVGIYVDGNSNGNTGIYNNTTASTLTAAISNFGVNPLSVISSITGTLTAPACGAFICLTTNDTSALGYTVTAKNSGGAAVFTLNNDAATQAGLLLGGSAISVSAFRNNLWFFNGGGDITVRANAHLNLIAGNSGTVTNGASLIGSTLQVQSGGVFAVSSTTDSTGAADTGISRDAAGTIDVGNGTAADKSGTIKAASLLVTGIVDGEAPTTVTTGTTATLGGTYKSGYTFNENATAATAVAYTLPTAAAGLQYCVGNAYNGTAANTGVLTVNTSATGQFIIFTDGTLSATGGNVTSGGAAMDFACFVGVDSTHWYFKPSSGTWAKH